MESQTNLLEQRRFKLAELKRLGYDPYPHKFEYTHTIGQLRTKLGPVSGAELQERKESVRICGRIVSLRPHGKAGFMDLSDGEHRFQVYARRDFVGPENFELDNYNGQNYPGQAGRQRKSFCNRYQPIQLADQRPVALRCARCFGTARSLAG